MGWIKLAGTGMILAASLWAGLHAALRLRRSYEELRDLLAALELMAGEISFAAPPFVPLCRRAGEGRCPAVRRFFEQMALEGSCPEADPEGRTRRICAETGLLLPGSALLPLERLFDDFGRYDREGQLRQLGLAAGELKSLTDELGSQLANRCKSYALLGLSAGTAVLVLVL